MPYSVTYRDESDLIAVSVDGELNMTVFMEIAAEVGRLIKKHSCNRILNDMRNAFPPESVGDTYFMPEKALALGVARNIRRALIVSGNFEDYRFMETVFINQGNIVKLFDNIDEAQSWLLSDSKSV
jgi:hypothetical protein